MNISSSSSLSRNSNRSESSGYCGGQPSTFDSSCSQYALPQPISRHKGKEHKKKKSKTTTSTGLCDVETRPGSPINSGKQNGDRTYDSNGSSSDFTSNCKKTEDITDVELADDTGLGTEINGDSNSTVPERGIGTITNSLENTSSDTNAGFFAVISLKSGLVVDTTPSLKTILNYSRESWIDRSFIEFVHPKDKQLFADHLANNIVLPHGNNDTGLNRCQSVFCRLKKNDETRSTTESTSDESNAAAANQYIPFHLTTTIKFFRDGEKKEMMFLTVIADPVLPVYKAPEEMIISAIFSTRHDPSCILTHVDVNVIQYFGYLPQDMIGRSLFHFYHPEDLPFLKDVYETIVKMEGTPFRSKPYRFAIQNGDYVVLETEWSSFMNPWRRKLEIVVGHHRILRGPTNLNIFQLPGDCQRSSLSNISEEIYKESKIIEEEIKVLLNETIPRMEEEYDITSKSKNLDTFVDKLLREVKPLASICKDRFSKDDRSFLERDSVIMGAISSHDEYDSKSSTETLPSYNQLNYNEKLTRFFDSKLHVTTYCSQEDNLNTSFSNTGDTDKTRSNLTENATGTKNTTLSTSSNNRTSHDSRDDSDNPCCGNTMPNENLKIPTLTESALNKHNQDMEKLMIQQHKQRRCAIKKSKNSDKASRLKRTKENSSKRNKGKTTNIGTKRRNTDAPEEENCKILKYNENARTCTVAPLPAMTSPSTNLDNSKTRAEEGLPNKPQSQFWPSMTVAVSPPLSQPHPSIASANGGIQKPTGYPEFSPFLPVYYVPLPQISKNFIPTANPPVSLENMMPTNQNAHQPQQTTYVPYTAAPLVRVLYPPMICEPVPVPTMYRPFIIPEPVPLHRETLHSASGHVQEQNSYDCIMRPASQATSIKAEPGSTKVMSESSKKLHSPDEYFSSCVSIDGGCTSLLPDTKHETNTYSLLDSNLEDSSDSSFYGSFLTASNENSGKPKQSSWKPPLMPCTSNDRKRRNSLRREPPWQEGVEMTKELIYQYQIIPKPLNEVLESDMKALKNLNQSQLVKNQLNQLYSDMELNEGGFVNKLVVCEHDVSMDSKSSNSNNYDNTENIMSEQ